MTFIEVPELDDLREEEDLWDHIGDFFSQAVKGFIQGFTTLSVGDEEPEESYEQIAYSIGNLLGFLGIVPGVGTAGSLIARGGIRATKGIVASARFASTGLRYTRLVSQTQTQEQRLALLARSHREMKAKHDVVKREWDIVGAKVRKGVVEHDKVLRTFKDDFGNYPSFRSVPFWVADTAQNAFLHGVRKQEWLKPLTTKFLTPGQKHYDTLKQAYRIGTAFAVGSWQDGAMAMGQSFAMGAILGGFDKVIVNAPAFRPQLRIPDSGNLQPRFRDLSGMMKGTPEQQTEGAKILARALAGGSLNLTHSAMIGDPLELQAYNFLLGAWFGGKEISASQERVMQFIQNARRLPGGLHSIDKTAEFTGQGKDRYGNDVIPFDEEAKAEIMRWKKRTAGDIGEALTVLSGAREMMRGDVWESFVKGHGVSDDLAQDLVERRGLISQDAMDRFRQRMADEKRQPMEDDLYQAIYDYAAEQEGLPRDVTDSLASLIGKSPEEQRRLLKDLMVAKREAAAKNPIALRGLDLFNLETRPMDIEIEAQAASIMRDTHEVWQDTGLKSRKMLEIVEKTLGVARNDAALPSEVQKTIIDISREAEIYRQQLIDSEQGKKPAPEETVEELTGRMVKLMSGDSAGLPSKEKMKLRHVLDDYVHQRPKIQMAAQQQEARKAYMLERGLVEARPTEEDIVAEKIAEKRGEKEINNERIPIPSHSKEYRRPRVLVTGGREWGEKVWRRKLSYGAS